MSFLESVGISKIKEFGVSFFVDNVGKIKDIGIDTLLKLNPEQIPVVVSMIVLPTIVPVLPKCLEYTNGLDFIRCIEIESLKILLGCGNTDSDECKQTVCKFYIDIVKFMILRELPTDSRFKNIIDILQQIQEFANTLLPSVADNFPLIGNVLSDKGKNSDGSLPSLRNLFSNILFPDNILAQNYIINDISCKYKLIAASQSFENLYPLIFNPLVLELANKLFIIIDFPDKYRILFNRSTGSNSFVFQNIKPKQFEFEINGCST